MLEKETGNKGADVRDQKSEVRSPAYAPIYSIGTPTSAGRQRSDNKHLRFSVSPFHRFIYNLKPET